MGMTIFSLRASVSGVPNKPAVGLLVSPWRCFREHTDDRHEIRRHLRAGRPGHRPVAAIVRERLEERPVVVVSALAKITDQLLAMASAAGAGQREKALELSRAARERHYNCASDLLGTHAFEQIAPELEADFDGLDELLRGVVAVGNSRPGPRTTSPASASASHPRSPPPHFHSAISRPRTLIPASAS